MSFKSKGFYGGSDLFKEKGCENDLFKEKECQNDKYLKAKIIPNYLLLREDIFVRIRRSISHHKCCGSGIIYYGSDLGKVLAPDPNPNPDHI